MTEEWKPIPGWEDRYEASTLGRIRRIHASLKTPNKYPAKGILSPATMRRGYMMIPLYRERGNRIAYRLSRLILRTFAGEPPSNTHQVNHKNGNTSDDRLDNLEWVTPRENCNHALYILGHKAKMPRGAAHHNAVLTEDIIRQARIMATNGRPHHTIAEHFGVSRSAITAALSGRTWAHLAF